MRRITITDEVGDSGTVTVDKGDAAEAIRPWYPEAPADVTKAIDDLQAALNRHESTYGLEEALGVKITFED
jgi:hypothetical protein